MSLCALPAWFKQEIPDALTLERRKYVSGYRVNTVCVQARCPNESVCLKAKKLTFLILGPACTRHCGFCAVEKNKTDRLTVDGEEPLRISQLVTRLELRYVVLTSVARDDLSDCGAAHFAKTIEAIYRGNPEVVVEALIPDFLGYTWCLEAVAAARPAVVAHNIEIVPRLYGQLRPEAGYGRSLGVLQELKHIDRTIFTKSSLMVGLGETEEEVVQVMQDLRVASCDIFTIGQYLAPSVLHYPVKEFVPPEQFRCYQRKAYELGFKAVLAGPLVRSSYRAEEVYREMLCTM